MKIPSVSVVICAQNVVDTIDQCLASIIQNISHGYIGEVIVVDGHSVDGTREIVEKYPVIHIQDKYRFPYVYSIPKNIGWRHASYELVMFLDADAYFSDNLFPDVTRLFEDEKVGVVGVSAKAVVSNNLTKTIGQWWDLHYYNSIKPAKNKFSSLAQRIYNNATSFTEQLLPAGPCYVVRRECLERIGGFDELNRQTAEDIRLSKAIISDGWKACWWLDSQVNHYPPSRISGLMKQRYHWGKGDRQFICQSTNEIGARLLPPVVRFMTPVLGIKMAFDYKNPFQAIYFPLAHYAWITGYLMSIFTGH